MKLWWTIFKDFILTIFAILGNIVLSWAKFVYTPRKDLKGEIVLLTGAAGGLGRLLAEKLANQGCSLILWDINEPAVVDLKENIAQLVPDCKIRSYKCDITDHDEVQALSSDVIQEVGHPTILINNAAMVTGKYFSDISQEEIEKVFQVNVLSQYRLVKIFLPNMLKENHGHVVCLSSILALDSLAGVSDYGPSKAAVTAFMQSLRQEIRGLGKDNVHCTTVLPYQIHTQMFKGCAARFPNFPLLNIQSPDHVTSEILDAIEKNQVIKYIPRVLYIVMTLSVLLPVKAIDCLHDFMQTNTAMKKWTGRSEVKKKGEKS